MPLWYGTEMNSHFEVQGGASDFAVGQKVQITGKLGKREVSLTVVITAYRWERLLEWQFQDSYGVRGLQRWELEACCPARDYICATPTKCRALSGRLIDACFHAFRCRSARSHVARPLAAPSRASLSVIAR